MVMKMAMYVSLGGSLLVCFNDIEMSKRQLLDIIPLGFLNFANVKLK